MRKAIILGFCLLLSGCVRIDEVLDTKPAKKEEHPQIQDQDKKKRVFICQGKSNEEITFEAKGDHLRNMTHIFYMRFEEVGITEKMDKKQMEAAINASLKKSYGSIDGVDVIGSIEEKRVKITIHIDYEKADADTLIQEGLLHEGEKETQYVSLKETLEDYTSNQFACKQQ